MLGDVLLGMWSARDRLHEAGLTADRNNPIGGLAQSLTAAALWPSRSMAGAYTRTRAVRPGGQYASGRLPADHPLCDVIRAAHRDVSGGREATLRERVAPYGSDLRLYAAEGIPTLHFGPGDVRLAHGPRERVSLTETVAVARALVVTVLRTVGVS